MSVTLFGILWVIAAFFAVIADRINAMVVFTMASMVLQCDVVLYFGGVGVGPQILASVLFIVKSLVYASTKSRMHFNPCITAAAALLAGVMLSSIINGVASEVAMNFAQLAIYVICFMRFYVVPRYINRETIIRYFTCLTIFVVIVGALQFFATLGVFPRAGLLPTLIYNDPGPNIYFNAPILAKRLYATFMEPSYCAAFLVGAFYFLMLAKKEKAKKDHALLIAILIEIVATQSTTAYLAFVVMGAVCIVFFKDKATAKYLIPEMMILMTALLISPGLLDTVIFSKAESGSALVRDAWNTRALDSFFSSPLFGVGYKQRRASSLVICLLAEVGIVGLILFVALLSACFISSEKAYRRTALPAKALLAAGVVCMVAAIPDLDSCVLWLFLYVFAALSPARAAASQIDSRRFPSKCESL